MKFRGVSPLIASVILIALTMVIAGIMATYATSISEERLLQVQQCSPALTLLDLDFNNGNVTTRIVNNNKKVVMQDISVSIIYEDPAKNLENIPLDKYAPKDSLNPLERMTVVIPTNDTTSPRKLEVVSLTCSEIPVSGSF